MSLLALLANSGLTGSGEKTDIVVIICVTIGYVAYRFTKRTPDDDTDE